MKHSLLAATALGMLALASPVPASATDLGFYLTTMPVQVLPEVRTGIRNRLHLENIGGYRVFCSFSLTNKTQPALSFDVAGSFEVLNFHPIDFPVDGMPQEALWCVSAFPDNVDASSPNASGNAFTVSVNQSGL